MANKDGSYPSDVTDEEWEFCEVYLSLMREDAPQRKYPLREVFNALRYLVRSGCGWRMLPRDFPPWHAVWQQTQRWVVGSVFERMAGDLRELLRVLADKQPRPTAMILDSRTVQSTPTSGARAAYDGAKRRKGSKVHIAVDTLGHLLALHVTAANEQDRAQVGELARQAQQATGKTVRMAFADQGYTGAVAADAAHAEGIAITVIKLPEAKRGFVLLPRRWVVERSFGWAARFRRIARDYERLAQNLAAYHWLAFISIGLASLFRQSA